MGGEPLLAGSLGLRLQNLMDELEERFHLPLGPRLTEPVAGRFLVGQDLLQRPPAEVVLVAGGPLAQLVRQYQATDFGPEFHIGVHSCVPLRRWRRDGEITIFPQFADEQLCAPEFNRRNTHPAPPFSNAVKSYWRHSFMGMRERKFCPLIGSSFNS